MSDILRKIKRIYYSISYGIKFEKGYCYKRIGSQFTQIFEMRHQELTDEGWEKFTDFYYRWGNAVVWYRKKRHE